MHVTTSSQSLVTLCTIICVVVVVVAVTLFCLKKSHATRQYSAEAGVSSPTIGKAMPTLALLFALLLLLLLLFALLLAPVTGKHSCLEKRWSSTCSQVVVKCSASKASSKSGMEEDTARSQLLHSTEEQAVCTAGFLHTTNHTTSHPHHHTTSEKKARKAKRM
jgi:hypothetical protein